MTKISAQPPASHAPHQGLRKEPRGRSHGSLKDDPLSGRFELYDDGVLVAFVPYMQRGYDIVLLPSTVRIWSTEFLADVEAVTFEKILLNLHRRRLNVSVQCPRLRLFLSDTTVLAQEMRQSRYLH